MGCRTSGLARLPGEGRPCARRRRFASSLVLAALLLAPSVRGQPPRPGPWEHYERFIAIDGACGWPNLSLLPDGTLAALIWPYANHGVTEGSAECWTSTDGGSTWRKAGVPVPHAPGTNRMNVAAGAVGDRLLALVGGWDRRRPYTPGPSMGPDAREGAVTLAPIAATSADSGATWQSFPDLNLPPRPGGRGLVPYGRIARLADGAVGVCLYGNGVYFYASSDAGATWSRRGTIVAGNTHNETNWVQLNNGELFAAARTYGDIRLDGYRSSDGGRTWQAERPLTLARQHPADLLKLPDGRVLLSYASRNPGLYAIWVQLADPDARAWSAPLLLVDLEGSSEFQRTPVPSSDGGYPSTVQLSDGTLVTAYYSRGVPAHQRYHVGVVRWRLKENGLPVLRGSSP